MKRYNKKYLYEEWRYAEKDGDLKRADEYKEEYRKVVMRELIKPYHWYKDELKQFETVILN